jgi:AmiR/NasT family two-component response regulator
MSSDAAFGRSGQVRSAQGMVAAQMGCTVEEALRLMAAHADTTDMTLEELAAAVVERRIRFDD